MVDLNVLLDVLQRREPHLAASARVLAMSARGEIKGLLASHCLTTLHYVIARHAGRAKADATVDWVLANLTVRPAGHEDFLRARALRMADFEDAVVAAVAEAARCQCVVTRNVADLRGSPVPALTPDEFLARYGREA
jgi:predicted nucleic acid-binding protein